MNLYGSNEANAVPECNCCPETLAIATVPCQKWNGTYSYEKALSVGTIFPDLHMPFFKGGDTDGE